MPFSQIFPPSPSPTESIRLIYTSVSLLLSRTQGYCYHLSKFHIYALVDHFKSLYRICYSIASVLCFGFFGREACGISAPRPGFEPTLPELKGQVLTTGPPRKSPPPLFLSHSLCCCHCELPISSLPASPLSLLSSPPLFLSLSSP